MISPGYSRAAAVTPSDSANVAPAFTAKALYIGVAGDLRVTMAGGGVVTFPNVPAGLFYVSAKRVHSTGTTATDIFILGD